MEPIDLFQTFLLVLLLFTVVRRRNDLATSIIQTDRRVILDSCALIDGRIVDLARAGFVAGQLIVPEFITRELQMLADGNDSQKRERARFGLDVVRELQQLGGAAEVVLDHSVIEKSTTDDKLVELAKKLNAELYTTDFNLGKVASVEGVRVLNINELAQHIRPPALPGEERIIKIVQKGSGRGQGVGYLDDGTMIVVDGAAKRIGQKVTVTVNRTHQTVAGKMLFGELKI